MSSESCEDIEFLTHAFQSSRQLLDRQVLSVNFQRRVSSNQRQVYLLGRDSLNVHALKTQARPSSTSRFPLITFCFAFPASFASLDS
jgi:hypothetical protein